MTTASASSLPLEGVCCSTSCKTSKSWIKCPFVGQRLSELSGVSLRSRNLYFGSTQFHWMPNERDVLPSKVCVSSDYSNSVPNSSHQMGDQGYHPLEDLKVSGRTRKSKLACPEIARTTVEANSSALLLIPGSVHCEPHEQISWVQVQYVVDDYGDIFFKIHDDGNILQDRGASNPVNALIGMDIPTYVNKMTGDYSISNTGTSDYVPFSDDHFEVMDSDIVDFPSNWGPQVTNGWVHPIYFAKCLSKAVSTEYGKIMDHPSNGVSIVGCLVPAFADEESYLRRVFHCEDYEEYDLDCKDSEKSSSSFYDGGSSSCSTFYRLEMMRIELFTVYGGQYTIDPEDFQEAEPDILVHCTSAIVKRFNEKRNRCSVSLKALCKKKGICVEGAKLIGVDSLGIDVRVSFGVEVQTYRFPFKAQATSEAAVEKQIQQLLFPRSQRKRLKASSNEFGNLDCFS